MSTSFVSCGPEISTWIKRGRSCASLWPGGSSTRWTTCWKPGALHRFFRTTTPAAGTTTTKVGWYLQPHPKIILLGILKSCMCISMETHDLMTCVGYVRAKLALFRRGDSTYTIMQSCLQFFNITFSYVTLQCKQISTILSNPQLSAKCVK